MISSLRNRFLATFVTIHMVLFVSSPAFAALVPSFGPDGKAQGDALKKDISTIEQALETKMVQEKLMAYGLTTDEVAAKIPSMTPDQIHMLATASHDVLSGGDSGLEVIVVLLVIIILFIVILKLMNKDIIIKLSGLDDYPGPDCAYLG